MHRPGEEQARITEQSARPRSPRAKQAPGLAVVQEESRSERQSTRLPLVLTAACVKAVASGRLRVGWWTVITRLIGGPVAVAIVGGMASGPNETRTHPLVFLRFASMALVRRPGLPAAGTSRFEWS